ncbi:11556_t:CDS:2 [Scutellospora calospora]|uniref:11556_t:CDS:1 n=1 Tax=Scutellospora calospora TaxID=85575 RepID=A0ACA9M3J8_9GLOM|nr:11556_t:CDS:2 [Scutellospora calospora]
MVSEQKFSKLSQSTISSIETLINSFNLSSKIQTSNSTKKSSSKKIKPVNRDSLLTLKKLIKESTTPISTQILSKNTIILQQSNNEDALVNDKIREHIPNQDKITETNLRKRKERAKKVFRLFNSIGGENMIKSFFASNISNLSLDDIDYVIRSKNFKRITAPL